MVLGTRIGIASAKAMVMPMIGLTRFVLGIETSRPRNFQLTCSRFAIFLMPGSKQASAVGRIVSGMDPRSYRIVLSPSRTPEHLAACGALPGTPLTIPREPQFPWLAALSKPTRALHLMFSVWRRGANVASALKREQVEILIACSGDSVDSLAAFLASKILGCRFGMYLLDDIFYRGQGPAGSGLRISLEQIVATHFGVLLVPNEVMQLYYWKRFNKTSALIAPPGAPLQTDADRLSSEDFEVFISGIADDSNCDALNGIANGLSRHFGAQRKVVFHSTQRDLQSRMAAASHLLANEGLPIAVAQQIQGRAHLNIILLALADDTPSAVTAGTVDLAEALSAKAPILAICSEGSYVANYLARHDCGVSLTTAKVPDVVRAVKMLLGNPSATERRMKNAIERAAVDFDAKLAQRGFIDAIGMIALPGHQLIPPPAPTPGKLKIAMVSAYDILGIQANGFLLHKYFHETGHDSRMLVHFKLSTDEGVHQLGSPLQFQVNRTAALMEKAVSTRSVLSTLGRGLQNHPKVADADIVNIQLIHANPFYSLLGLPGLTRAKRVVLSIHDMFLLTGHCVYAMECERWKTGCGSCPDLARPFRFLNDTTAFNWKLKRAVYDRSRLDLIVASPWMRRQVEQSPLLSRFPVHYIPFGIDERVYRLTDRVAARAQFGIPADAHVITFRSAPHGHAFKGTKLVEAALSKYSPTKPTYLITLDGLRGLDSIREKYRFIELGWINDQHRIADALNASDLFLMPSTAESFGLMAIESMACGTPVIVSEGTALPETVNAPHSGIAVPQGDSDALARAIEDCMGNESLLARLRENGLRYVAENHAFKAYGDRHLELFGRLAAAR